MKEYLCIIILNPTLRSLPLPESSRSSDSTLTVSWKFDGSLTVADSTFDFSNKAKSSEKKKQFHVVYRDNLIIRCKIVR